MSNEEEEPVSKKQDRKEKQLPYQDQREEEPVNQPTIREKMSLPSKRHFFKIEEELG